MPLEFHDTPIKIGISACLLGHKVRFDGGHQQDRFLTDTLGKFVEYVPVCPEVECGMSVPREAMRLVGDPAAPRLTTVHTQKDLTRHMTRWAEKRVVELEKENLCGFIFKKNSPSSGMTRVKVYSEKGQPARTGSGLFARAFMDHFPLLPAEEDGRLNDPKLRENFIESIFVFKRYRTLLEQKKSRGALVYFHTRHKLLIMAHSPTHYKRMGKLVADSKQMSADELYLQYETLLSESLRLKTTLKKNVNALMHIMGYFKENLTPDEKQELLELLDMYRKGQLPIIVPVTLLNHYVRKYDQPYLKSQYYLNPHPAELQLRNHV